MELLFLVFIPVSFQNSSLSLPWLSSMIESSSDDCLEIMPIQCICEFIWNLLSGANNGEDLNIKVTNSFDHLMLA